MYIFCLGTTSFLSFGSKHTGRVRLLSFGTTSFLCLGTTSFLSLGEHAPMQEFVGTFVSRGHGHGRSNNAEVCAESENDVVPNLKKIYELQLLVLKSTNKANTLRTFLLQKGEEITEIYDLCIV